MRRRSRSWSGRRPRARRSQPLRVMCRLERSQLLFKLVGTAALLCNIGCSIFKFRCTRALRMSKTIFSEFKDTRISGCYCHCNPAFNPLSVLCQVKLRRALSMKVSEFLNSACALPMPSWNRIRLDFAKCRDETIGVMPYIQRIRA